MITEDENSSDGEKLTLIKEISENLLHVLEDLRIVVSPERALESKELADDPVRIITRALSPLHQLAQGNGLKIHLELQKPEGKLFTLNGQSLRQSVTNLVKNAAIHSGGDQIFVNFNYEMNGSTTASAVLRVEDDGKGIPLHLREKVFVAFGRGETSKDGSGLGLFIVNQMSQMMGGKLSYSESDSGGACFELSFPMRVAPSEAEVEAEILNLNGLRVLLAEDERMLRMLTENVLAKEGASVDSYENGRLALNAFVPDSFDLVITDLMMPEMNGHELTKAIRSQSTETIIIAVTAAVLGEETAQFIDEGADFVLPKPISRQSLITALSQIKHKRGQSNKISAECR